MWELLGKPILDAAIALSKDFLKARVDEFNRSALERKRAEVRKRLKQDNLDRIKEELSRVSLNDAETAAADVDVPASTAAELLNAHLHSIQQWSSRVGFSDLRGTKTLNDIYVQLDTYLTPTRLHLDQKEREQRIPLERAIFNEKGHAIVLGHPGAGKTTSMKRLCATALPQRDNMLSAGGSRHSFPLLIKFRDLPSHDNPQGLIARQLQQIFPLQLSFSGPLELDKEASAMSDYKERSFLIFIDALSPLILLDGFDEYSNNAGKHSLAQEIRQLAETLTKAKIVITCRTGEFAYNLDNASSFEIATLKREQIEYFSRRWIQNSTEAEQFVTALFKSPFADTAIKPLSLAHLCAIYERIGQIPDRPKTVYRKIVALLLEEWDQQRSVRRYSKYAKFEADRKFDFLAHLSFSLSTKTRRSVFSKNDFIDSYGDICDNFGLERSESNLVISEIESHTGLFLQSGYAQFEFAHKSIQEYLAAEYIVKLPSIPRSKQMLEGLGAELAVAVAISSNPSAYLSDLVLNVTSREDLPSSFYEAFVSRILLEKPDFYHNEAVILGFFTLLTLWINMGRHSILRVGHRKMRDEELDWYNALLSLISASNHIDVISKYYATPIPHPDSELYSLRRRAFLSGFKLPTFLLVPRAFVHQYIPNWQQA